MKIRLVLLFSLILLAPKVFSQRCVTDQLHHQKMLQNPEYSRQFEEFKQRINRLAEEKQKQRARLKGLGTAEQVYTIPVVVHIIHNSTDPKNTGGALNTNITDAQVYSQIQILNQDYRNIPANGASNSFLAADSRIEFCLASADPNGNYTTGITRTYYNKSSWDYSLDDALLKSLAYWPSDRYLNIWVCHLAQSGGQNVLGYAQFPSDAPVGGLGGNEGGEETDGVVIDYKFFGNTGAAVAPFNLGRTTTHEVGHWLGLFHLWGDMFCGDDYVSDTPWDKSENSDTDCSDSSDCDGDGNYTQDLTNDYMDYSHDICMNLFTFGQKDRMRTVMENAPRRLALLSSPGCCVSPDLALLPVQEGFENNAFLSTGGWTIENPDGDQTWEVADPGAYSFSSAVLKNDSCSPGQKDYLITPFIKLSQEEPALEFDLAYAQDVTAGTDTLVVSYSTNCQDWTPLATFYGSSLITTSAVAHNFMPSASDWKRIRLDLEALNHKPVGRIRFENRSAKKNNLYIDNVNIYKTSGKLKVLAYPNPTVNQLKIDLVFNDVQDVTYLFYDMLGQQVHQETDRQQRSYTKVFDLSYLKRGMYIVKIIIPGQQLTQKVLLTDNL